MSWARLTVVPCPCAVLAFASIAVRVTFAEEAKDAEKFFTDQGIGTPKKGEGVDKEDFPPEEFNKLKVGIKSAVAHAWERETVEEQHIGNNRWGMHSIEFLTGGSISRF